MSTIINTPQRSEDTDSGLGMVVGIIFALIVIGLFFFYAIPAIRTSTMNSGTQTPQNNTFDVNVKMPTPETNPATPATPASTRNPAL